MSTVMGNSGFEYDHTDTWSLRGYHEDNHYDIKDSETGKTLFTMKAGNEWNGKGYNATETQLGSVKTILGKDEKYYYLSTLSGSLQWGIVQTTGVVLKSDRSVLTTINMHPLYETRPQVQLVPSIKPKAIPTPIITVTPKVTTTVTPKVRTKPSLLDRIINWLEKVLRL